MWGPASRADYVDPLGLLASTPIRLKPLHQARDRVTTKHAATRHSEDDARCRAACWEICRHHEIIAPALRFGLTTAMPRGADFGDFAVACEEAGFDILTFPDHLVPILVTVPIGATAAACATAHLRTGTLVLNNDLRHPVEVARETATLAGVTRAAGSSWASGPGT